MTVVDVRGIETETWEGERGERQREKERDKEREREEKRQTLYRQEDTKGREKLKRAKNQSKLMSECKSDMRFMNEV